MADPRCQICGEPGRYNAFLRGPKGRKKPLQNPGWAHADAMKRDHKFQPEAGRTPEADLSRQEAERDQARSMVNTHMQKQFDYLNAENTINDIFKDRRD